MSAPMAVSLTSLKNGEQFIFGSISQACDFLHRSKTYVKYKMFEEGTLIVLNSDNEGYELEVIGIGRRRDSVEKPIRKKDGGINAHQYPQQLCVSCARACGFCSWSQKLEPVEGWEARAVRVAFDGSKNWLIEKCPLYIRDAPTVQGRRRQRETLIKELENEAGTNICRKAGPAASAAACKESVLVRAAAQALAEAAARASDQRECALC